MKDMNILYYTCDKVHSTKGGTERTTITVASQLKALYGCKCFSIYEREAPTAKESCFEQEFFWPIIRSEKKNIKFLRNIIISHNIDVVIVQGAFIHVPRFRKAIEGLKCRLLFAHHFQPGWELVFFKFKDVIRRRPKSFTDFLRWGRDVLLFPRMRKKYVTSLVENYKRAYEAADNVVLLSKEFIKGYCSFGGIMEFDKFRIIPNGLSFNEYLPAEEINNKKPVVLIVSRLDDAPKKLTIALRIWGNIKHNPIAKDWELKIVGTGPDEEMYHRIVKREHLPDVIFTGRMNPVPYYKEASIFMMTSKSESWGLTLTEAQQMGVVPIAFNTYESLTDIITDGIDGRIISEGDIEGYSNALIQLMGDRKKREVIAEKGLTTCRRFSSEKIAAKWWKLING